jgi:hypothetical protein
MRVAGVSSRNIHLLLSRSYHAQTNAPRSDAILVPGYSPPDIAEIFHPALSVKDGNVVGGGSANRSFQTCCCDSFAVSCRGSHVISRLLSWV